MIINIADKGLKLNQHSKDYLHRRLQKINKILPDLKSDLPLINFFIRKNDDQYHVERKYRHTTHDYSKVKSALAHFEGWMRLILPRKALYVHFKGLTVEECIHYATKHLISKVKKYKDLHFKSQSQYPSHESIRGGNDYGQI